MIVINSNKNLWLVRKVHTERSNTRLVWITVRRSQPWKTKRSKRC